MIGDSTRLNSALTNGTFLPSAIPVPGEPFFGTHDQASVQGSGSSLSLNGQILTNADNAIQFSTKFLTQNTGMSTDPSTPTTSNPSVSIQQAYARISKVLVGVSESGFAPIDNSALPETLDLAGPGARVSVLTLGSTGAGQGRFSYYLFSTNDSRPGFTGIVSAENPVSEVTTKTAPAGTYGTMARCPDLTTTLRYSGGDYYGKDYIEFRNLQFATVWRSLGVETSDGTIQRDAFGWGASLTGGYKFFFNPALSVVDGAFFSVTYGQGLGHYILDLHGQNADATLNANNVLTPLPVLAWYVGYLHNWSDAWRSSVAYSHIDLQSINPPAVTAATSPYHMGESVSINLVYHKLFYLNDNTKSPHQFFTGIEAIWGERENLNGAFGAAERLMWVTSISN